MNTKIIACVLRTGGIYDAEYVNRLARGIARNVTIPYHFVCLTNDISAVFDASVHEVIPLKHDLPGWWSKVELFRRDLYINLDWFFVDLDTIILENIDAIVTHDPYFMALDDFYYPGQLGSGLMSWRQRWATHPYDDFIADSDRIIRSSERGDQQWIQNSIPSFATYQSLFPGSVVSFKKHCQRASKDIIIPNGAKILCFHGTPKPHELLQYNSIRENWK